MVRPIPAEDPDDLWREVWNTYPGNHAELSLLGRCGGSLAAVLRGTVNPLELLFPDGPTNTLATFYQNSPTFLVGNRMVEATLRTIQAALPPGRILRVLEIGAGTGGLTARLVPLLDPDRCTYTFTDLSPVFLSKAEHRFGDRPISSSGSSISTGSRRRRVSRPAPST